MSPLATNGADPNRQCGSSSKPKLTQDKHRVAHVFGVREQPTRDSRPDDKCKLCCVDFPNFDRPPVSHRLSVAAAKVQAFFICAIGGNDVVGGVVGDTCPFKKLETSGSPIRQPAGCSAWQPAKSGRTNALEQSLIVALVGPLRLS